MTIHGLNDAQTQALLQADAWLVSLSGGKDSACMLRDVKTLHQRHNCSAQLIPLHVDTTVSEWGITRSVVVRDTQAVLGREPVILQPDHDLLTLIDQRRAKLDADGRFNTPHFPTFGVGRYCTKGVKTSIIYRWIARTFPQDTCLINITGIRGEESQARQQRPIWLPHTRYPAAPSKGRRVIDWLPIHHLKHDEVWELLGWSLERLQALREQVQRRITPGDYPALAALLEAEGFPYHPAYALGSTRLSCSVCPLASAGDMRIGALWNPEFGRALIARELDTGFSLTHDVWLTELVPELVDPEQLKQLAAAKQQRATR